MRDHVFPAVVVVQLTLHTDTAWFVQLTVRKRLAVYEHQ